MEGLSPSSSVQPTSGISNAIEISSIKGNGEDNLIESKLENFRKQS